MTRSIFVRALLGGSALVAASNLQAQDAQPQAAPSQEQLNQLQSQMQAMQEQIQQLQAQLATQQKSVDAANATLAKATPALEKQAWASGTKISGKAFFNISSIDHENDGFNQSDNGVQTELKRFYVSVDHKFDDVFSANVTTDFRYGTNGTSKDVLVYVKKAFLQAKLSDAAVFRVGAADLPWVPFVEDVYGNRYVENVIIDRTKYGTSSDWGVHFFGSALGGKVSYAVSAVNGAGYKTLSRSSNSIDLEGRLSVKPTDFLVFAVGGYTGKLGKSTATNVTEHRATRLDLLAAYTGKRARFGVEWFQAKNWKNVTTIATDKTSGWSAFGSFAINDKLGIFGRFDRLNPDQTSNDPLKENYFNVGLSYAVTKGVDMALVYKRDRADNGFVPTSNGTIGGIDQGTYDELGIWGQLKF